MGTFVESQPYLGNSDSQEPSYLSGQEIKSPLPFAILIMMFPLLILMAFLVTIIKVFKKDTPS